MKTFWKIITIAGLLVLLTVPGFSAAAEGPQPVTGACIFNEEPASPDVREWATRPDGSFMHIRNEYQLLTCDFNDDRMDGDYLLRVSWDVIIDFSLFPYWITGHDHGLVEATDAASNVTWKGHYNTWIDETSKSNGTMILSGMGPYKSLHFNGTVFFDFADPTMMGPTIEGVIR